MADPVGPVPAMIDEVSRVGEAAPSFEAFYENTHARLYTALCLVTGSRHEAEEVMQDAFVRVWERWDKEVASKRPRDTSTAPR
jgi:DNA-directed RNA polymerase specialized sigma24 family protein